MAAVAGFSLEISAQFSYTSTSSIKLRHAVVLTRPVFFLQLCAFSMRAPHTAQCHLAIVIKYRPFSANAMRFSTCTTLAIRSRSLIPLIQDPSPDPLLYMHTNLVPGSAMSILLLGTNKTADEKGTAYISQSNQSGT